MICRQKPINLIRWNYVRKDHLNSVVFNSKRRFCFIYYLYETGHKTFCHIFLLAILFWLQSISEFAKSVLTLNKTPIQTTNRKTMVPLPTEKFISPKTDSKELHNKLKKKYLKILRNSQEKNLHETQHIKTFSYHFFLTRLF